MAMATLRRPARSIACYNYRSGVVRESLALKKACVQQGIVTQDEFDCLRGHLGDVRSFTLILHLKEPSLKLAVPFALLLSPANDGSWAIFIHNMIVHQNHMLGA